MKSCSVCEIEKATADFNWRNKAKGWRRPECRECQRAAYQRDRARDPAGYNAATRARKRTFRERHPNAGKDWYAANREQELARCATKHAANPELNNRRSRAWYAANKERHGALVAAWSGRNAAYLTDYHQRYAVSHRVEFAEKRRRRRALELKRTIVQFAATDLDARMSVFANRCSYCGGPFQEVDHVIPLSRGGLHCLANLRPACRPCNRRKWAKSLSDWIKTK